MPKMKPHKGVSKRVKVTGNQKVKHKRSGTSHLMRTFSGKRRRQHRRAKQAPDSVTGHLESMLHMRIKGRERS